MREVAAKIVLIIATLLAVSIALYYVTLPTPCESFTCFQDKMSACERGSFINEEPQASWRYTIQGTRDDQCQIEVTLLQAKEGPLQLREFEGHSMTCGFAQGLVTYPDKDLSVCHGLLKEDLQGVIIEKLHAYLLENLLNVQEALGLFNQTTNDSLIV